MARRYQADMDDAELQQAKQEGRAYYALYNYEARSAEEVSLEENDTIVDAEAVDDIVSTVYVYRCKPRRFHGKYKTIQI
eukprot:m.35919 g.35919  ORF g.35919 m.35919 type:complete len:79 (+) comp32188_c0_seq1:2574-2810(+)